MHINIVNKILIFDWRKDDMADFDSKSWYTRYRPKTLDEYSGPAIKQIIQKRFVDRANFPHTIYIHGPRGTGKTTFGRLISKYYQCENPKEDGSPCEECQTCQEINEILIGGESGIDAAGVQEINATIVNGKDDIMSLVDDAMVAPMYSTYKIIIFDECHRLSPAAQDVLLKVIEDIPDHLVCIFCTTEDHKVLQTIKSRMQLTIEARKQTIPDMVHRLKQIAEMEGCTASEKALEIIAKKGDRVPRECINILESIAKTYDRQITVDNIREYLGDMGSELYAQYFEAANQGLIEIMNFIYKLRMNDVKIGQFVTGLMEYVLDALYIKHGVNRDEYPKEYVTQISRLFDNYESQDFDMLLQVLENADRSTSENDKKNEVILTIAAMRIGKIKMLASGLANIQEQAITENKTSMIEHGKLINKKQNQISEQLKIAITPAMLKEEFDNATVVADDIEIEQPTFTLPKVNMEELSQINDKSSTMRDVPPSTSQEVEDFFDSM